MIEISNMVMLKPVSLKNAMKRPDWKLWKKAMEEKLATLKEAKI